MKAEVGRIEATIDGEVYAFVHHGHCYKLYRDGIECTPIPEFQAFEAAFKKNDRHAFEATCTSVALELDERVIKDYCE